MTEEKRPQGRPRKYFKRLSLKMPPALCQLTSDTAKALNISQAELWEAALNEYIKQHKVNT